jgi:hypothetical protein
MSAVKLTAAEADVLRTVLGTLLVKGRTGELGVLHGADRFVSTQQILRKPDREALDAIARKVGLAGMASRIRHPGRPVPFRLSNQSRSAGMVDPRAA